MYTYTRTESRFVWDIYAEIAAKRYASKTSSPEVAARYAASFADAMCKERAKRFPPEDKKDK